MEKVPLAGDLLKTGHEVKQQENKDCLNAHEEGRRKVIKIEELS